MFKNYFERVEQARQYLASHLPEVPEILLILGTGLSGVGERIEREVAIPYREIPSFPVSTVESHAGELVIGRFAGRKVAAFRGRFHYYEGYSTRELTLPLRVMSLLGARILIVSNAAGGLNLNFRPGDLMLIRDHINLIPDNPLRGPNREDWGPRFPDLSEAYSRRLRELFWQTARELGEEIQEGVYVAVPGPSLETPAETRFLRLIGADAVGMSTVPEVIVAVHAGMEVLGVSVIANVNDPDHFKPILLEEVIAQAQAAEARLTRLIEGFIEKL